MRRRRTIAWAVAFVVLCAVVGVVAAVRRATPTAASGTIPTSRVKRGDLEMTVNDTGELRATHMETMTAPPIGGGSL